MDKEKLAYGSLGVGMALLVFSPTETLSIEEKVAGVMTWRQMGTLFVLIGGIALLTKKYMK
jgi:hypothetical protein